jgi:mRNA-degrading endonuclease RelE of RelBE toxin-antitoxin system
MDLLRFVQLPPFPRQWDSLKLGGEELAELEVAIMSAPEKGVVIPATNGLRKCRFVPRGTGQGKSGGYRVFYVYLPDQGTVLLWAIIAKNERANLSKADRNALSQQIGRIRTLLAEGSIQ